MSARASTERASLRGLLAFLAASAAFPGAWATVAPASFHRSFPLGGEGWVAPLGASSPHLLADVGAFYLAFGALFAWAAWRPDRALVVPLSLAWAGFSALHLGWHAAHLAPFSVGASVAQTASLAFVVAAPLFAAWLGARAEPDAAPRPAQPPAASQAA